MAQVSQLSPELARDVLHLARAILAAIRSWTLYPPEHPAVGHSLARLAEAIQQSSGGAIFEIGVTPDTLLIDGAPADATQAAIAEAAALLHDQDILTLTFVGEVPSTPLRTLLRVLTMDAAERRGRGGPALIWATEGHASIDIAQIDYKTVLEREKQDDGPEPARRDDLWRSIVASIVSAPKIAFDERAQQRLLAIAGSVPDIGDLATAVMAPKCTLDGSPLITSQAATVLAAYRHLTSIVAVMAPGRVPEVMSNLAAATSRLDPHVVMQVMQMHGDPDDSVGVVQGIASAFDDAKVAQLLATALALDGQASDRLATIFNTIAPDEDRKSRVLTLTRNLLSQTDFGRTGQFNVLWRSMEELLVSYNDKPFVSHSYRAALDGLGSRAEKMAALDLPPELAEWMQSLGQDSVRGLSVTLLTDLLSLERDPERAAQIAEDMEALAEDLLLSAAYADAASVTRALAVRADQPAEIGRDACRAALDRLGESLAMREAASMVADMDDALWASMRQVLEQVGSPSVEALKPLVMVEEETPNSKRAAEIIVGFGSLAVSRLAPLVSDSNWFVQRMATRLLGRIGVPEAVPLLQPLLRKNDPRVAREAVAALANIDDPSAARAIQTVLRSATGELRRAVVHALVADRDPRVVPMLVRIVEESEPLGRDHDLVLETITAMGVVGSEQAVAPLTKTIRQKALFRRRKLRAIKERGVSALTRIGGPQAISAIDDAERTGDRILKKVIAASRSGALGADGAPAREGRGARGAPHATEPGSGAEPRSN